MVGICAFTIMHVWSIVQRKLQTWASFSCREKCLLTLALILLPAITFSLQIFGFKLTHKFLAKLTHRPAADFEPLQKVYSTVRLLKTAARYYQPWANCLKQSLGLWTLLRLQGIASSLHIGVKCQTGQFTAHAWITWQGVVLNDNENVAEEYAAFAHQFEVT